MGLLICCSLEHRRVADASELLFQDCECNCSEISEKTTGQGTSRTDNKLVNACRLNPIATSLQQTMLRILSALQVI